MSANGCQMQQTHLVYSAPIKALFSEKPIFNCICLALSAVGGNIAMSAWVNFQEEGTGAEEDQPLELLMLLCDAKNTNTVTFHSHMRY